jgi:hypothetical protein
MYETFSKRLQHKAGIYQTKKIQNKQAKCDDFRALIC